MRKCAIESPPKKIVYITAGAAGMYCGSCMRDNALVTELKRIGGYDVTLLPLYTPIRTDEPDVSVDQIFFGGINVYLQQKIPLFRHLPRFLDRWLDNPKLVKTVASRGMSVNAKDLGSLTLSMVRGEHGHQKKEVIRLVEWLRDEAKPDLICLTNLLVGGCIPTLKEELPNVPVLVTLQGDDVFLDELIEPWREKILHEMKGLAAMSDGFITFSEYYRDKVRALFEIPEEKFHLTALGADLHDFHEVAPGKTTDGNTIGYFARICPEKGFDVLVSAFIELATRPGFEKARLKVGGYLGVKDTPFFDEQVVRLKTAGLDDRFEWIGSPELDGKLDFFKTIDVFSVPARFVEPKGIYAIEAMASGIPVVAPDRGTFPEMLESSGGGLIFPTEDADALADALGVLLQDKEKARQLAEAGRAWAFDKADRAAMAETTGAVFERFIG